MEREQNQTRNDILKRLAQLLRDRISFSTISSVIEALNVPIRPRRKWTRPPEPETGKLSLRADQNLNGSMNTMPYVNLPSREVHLLGYRGVNKVINDYNG